jgi:hypothetical protein
MPLAAQELVLRVACVWAMIFPRQNKIRCFVLLVCGQNDLPSPEQDLILRVACVWAMIFPLQNKI